MLLTLEEFKQIKEDLIQELKRRGITTQMVTTTNHILAREDINTLITEIDKIKVHDFTEKSLPNSDNPNSILKDSQIKEIKDQLTAHKNFNINSTSSTDCGSACVGGCYTACSTACKGCDGTCSGSCYTGCRGCDSTCSGSCYGCDGTCSGSCSGCDGTCSGQCTGCSSACSSGCSSVCSSSCLRGCSSTCIEACASSCDVITY